MGTLIKAKFEGRCKMCGSSWSVGDEISYQRTPKAICSDKSCFKEQGGTGMCGGCGGATGPGYGH